MALDHDTFELLKESVRRFVRERLTPAEDLVEENDEVPPELLQEMKDLGLCGLSIPEEYGGIGLSGGRGGVVDVIADVKVPVAGLVAELAVGDVAGGAVFDLIGQFAKDSGHF
jgi:alkylation response protein AidB-like acyl-CoA dehydrogenase